MALPILGANPLTTVWYEMPGANFTKDLCLVLVSKFRLCLKFCNILVESMLLDFIDLTNGLSYSFGSATGSNVEAGR